MAEIVAGRRAIPLRPFSEACGTEVTLVVTLVAYVTVFPAAGGYVFARLSATTSPPRPAARAFCRPGMSLSCHDDSSMPAGNRTALRPHSPSVPSRVCDRRGIDRHARLARLRDPRAAVEGDIRCAALGDGTRPSVQTRPRPIRPGLDAAGDRASHPCARAGAAGRSGALAPRQRLDGPNLVFGGPASHAVPSNGPFARVRPP